MLLEKWRVCRRPEGESNFLVFSQMLSGLSTDMRSVQSLELSVVTLSSGFLASLLTGLSAALLDGEDLKLPVIKPQIIHTIVRGLFLDTVSPQRHAQALLRPPLWQNACSFHSFALKQKLQRAWGGRISSDVISCFNLSVTVLFSHHRSELQLHQLKEYNSFGITCPTKVWTV